jgi:hypothetical protein
MTDSVTSPVSPNDHIWDRSALDLVNQIWAIPAEWPPTRRRAYAHILIIEALKAATALEAGGLGFPKRER